MRRTYLLALALLVAVVSAPEAIAQDPPGLGFSYQTGDPGLRVAILADDGPAGPAGLLVGDVITAVSGRSVAGLGPEDSAEWLASVTRSGLPVILDVTRGRRTLKVEITPAPYSRAALQAKTEARQRASADFDRFQDDSFPGEAFITMLDEMRSAPPEWAAFSQIMATASRPYRTRRDGAALVIHNATRRVRIPVSENVRVLPTTEGTGFSIFAPSLTIEWPEETPEIWPSASFEMGSRDDSDRAVETFRAVLRAWDAIRVGQAQTPPSSLEALAEAVNVPPLNRTVTREGDRLALRSPSCTIWLPLTRPLTVIPVADNPHFEVRGEGMEVQCSGNPIPSRFVTIDLDTPESRDAAVSALRALLGSGDDAPIAQDTGARTPDPATVCVSGTCTDGTGTMRYGRMATYEGEWRGGKRHGQGTLTEHGPGASTFVGEWANDSRVRGRETTALGSIYEGEYANDRYHGRGAMTYTTGTTFVGDWVDGQQHGRGTMTFATGDTFTGTWAEGDQVGQGTYTWADGRVYVGGWQATGPQGTGTLTWPEGVSLTGDWTAGALTRGVKTWPDGKRYEGGISGIHPQGDGTMRYPDGRVFVGTFTQGAPDEGTLQTGDGPPRPVRYEMNLLGRFDFVSID
ncbi:MAG: PDZ domain-containing protein [Bacteroidota bacterium]